MKQKKETRVGISAGAVKDPVTGKWTIKIKNEYDLCEYCDEHWEQCKCKRSMCCGVLYDEDIARCPECKENC